ncbi:GNAT family N-acetyltransferase [Micromonospora sp. CPCC 206060]|uniref:GNAT family N-acetyltransferase n=1 Tax=Micromonospora sp. CPCC 206060 TaxID=3122406 RepID=UPI002FF3CF20
MSDELWAVARVDVADAVSQVLLREYFTEIVGRWYGRAVSAGEVSAAMAEGPSDDLCPPTGLFLVGRYRGRVAGCVGLRWCDGYAELTRLFVRSGVRGCGGGAALLAEAARCARWTGFDRIRLDTRDDLVEARALYARHGFRPIPAYSPGPYAQHWFEKVLAG